MGISTEFIRKLDDKLLSLTEWADALLDEAEDDLDTRKAERAQQYYTEMASITDEAKRAQRDLAIIVREYTKYARKGTQRANAVRIGIEDDTRKRASHRRR